MSTRAFSPVLLLLGIPSCTLVLGDFVDDGAGGLAASSQGGKGGTSTSAGGAGGDLTTTSSGGAGGMGGGATCTTPDDCPPLGNECVAPTCVAGHCSSSPVEEGTKVLAQTPGDCAALVCDGAGSTKAVPDDTDLPQHDAPCSLDSCSGGAEVHTPHSGSCTIDGGQVCGDPAGSFAGQCIECNAAADCGSGVCEAPDCVPATCADNVKNGNETGADCGGACTPCGVGVECAIGPDCVSKVCGNTGVCAAPSCGDGLQNGTESSTDCGGACVRCASGKTCNLPDDCIEGVCQGNVCKNPTCFDGVANGSETDIDCGGACTAKCQSGQACGNAGDCESGVCQAALCQVATCGDHVMNGAETDVDCGGVTACSRCAIGRVCTAGSDCVSLVCQGGACQAPNCADGAWNGAESDVDCGGATSCARCSPGQGCLGAGDCASGVCKTAVCQAPACPDGAKNGGETDVDCGGAACPKCAEGLSCMVPSDCVSNVCAAGKCSAVACTDGQKNGSETDVDCGGANACPRCGTGLVCAQGGDCADGVCQGGTCQAPTCGDAVANGGETGVDCGGTTSCPRCVEGLPCLVPEDCRDLVCFGGACQAASCTDSVKNGAETDVDCGAPLCEKCGAGLTCGTPSDCQSGVCFGGACQAASCTDAVKNGSETDVDCGGLTCPKCADGEQCAVNADCQHSSCSGGVCISCADVKKNGSETDVDCGGPLCQKCGLGETCLGDTDCASSVCSQGKCVTCKPGATQCSSNALVTCGATGSWGLPAACAAATPTCCNGACTTAPAEVYAGTTHTCALKSDSTVWCWGVNSAGQLGDGTSVQRTMPVQVAALGKTVTQLALGAKHTCALKADKSVWCWGDNKSGQLGDNTLVGKSLPVQVTALGHEVVQIAAGASNTCAVEVNGSLWCWGDNAGGQLGTGGTGGPQSKPSQVMGLGTEAVQVAVGNAFVCAVQVDGALLCWGSNAFGQLGDGTTLDNTTPTQLTAFTMEVSKVAAGSWHACAVQMDNSLWCWGSNSNGQIGDGTMGGMKVTPTMIGLPGMPIDTVSANGWNTCARQDGTLWCWGDNASGQLGDGTTKLQATPIAVGSLGDLVVEHSVGAAHVCAVTSDSRLWCWGLDAQGQLGDGMAFPYRTRPWRSPMGVCSTDKCNNAAKDSAETDVDCGGSCLLHGLVCVDGKGCVTSGDCGATSLCKVDVCTNKCEDHVKDDAETDVDCGGPLCPGCAVGKHCSTKSDCATGDCISGVCASSPTATTANPQR